MLWPFFYVFVFIYVVLVEQKKRTNARMNEWMTSQAFVVCIDECCPLSSGGLHGFILEQQGENKYTR